MLINITKTLDNRELQLEIKDLRQAVFYAENIIKKLEKNLKAGEALGLCENNPFMVAWFFELEDKQIHLAIIEESLDRHEAWEYSTSVDEAYRAWRNS